MLAFVRIKISNKWMHAQEVQKMSRDVSDYENRAKKLSGKSIIRAVAARVDHRCPRKRVGIERSKRDEK